VEGQKFTVIFSYIETLKANLGNMGPVSKKQKTKQNKTKQNKKQKQKQKRAVAALLRRQRQTDLSELEAGLVYSEFQNSRVLKTKQDKPTEEHLDFKHTAG